LKCLARRYGPYSLQNVFSSSKVLESMVVAMLADRGHLRYSDLVSTHWPEYAQNGKGATTVAMLMRHEAGLPRLDTLLNAEDLTAEAIRRGAVSGILARQVPAHPPGEQRMCVRVCVAGE
jgi:CubicO group peptidase (beta-lactamase class C family)